jgi:hypothetical protein
MGLELVAARRYPSWTSSADDAAITGDLIATSSAAPCIGSERSGYRDHRLLSLGAGVVARFTVGVLVGMLTFG